jgi:hypothetical protein
MLKLIEAEELNDSSAFSFGSPIGASGSCTFWVSINALSRKSIRTGNLRDPKINEESGCAFSTDLSPHYEPNKACLQSFRLSSVLLGHCLQNPISLIALSALSR